MRSIVALVVTGIIAGSAVADSPGVALRVESLTVPPATGPTINVQVKNLGEEPYEGSLSLKGPKGWTISPDSRQVALKPNETRRVPFTIEKGSNVDDNSYPIEVTATASEEKIVLKQNVPAASAPYFKPTIDGLADEWKDSLPVAFTSGGKRSVISTYWNRRAFSILVAVEEDKLLPYKKGGPFDAVQLAISSQDAAEKGEDDEARRFEFLFVSTDKASADKGTEGMCFKLAEPDTKLTETAQSRELEPLEYEKAKVMVTRRGGTTYYECSIPFSLMRADIRPSEGRELFLAVLIHDADGTGIRDRGEAVGLWPEQRNRAAWSDFVGAKWGEKPPFDNKLYWGLCSSKH